ncbi:MAG: hypothetical protein CMH64_02645 [Nanoarchaeota archaeon]|nr:hypothetical protein [Nanoarchaeota archaeon]|tara:strand:+ start:1243 stop:2895 length:1653 start_codon:yes stop_codon:yes gene_type:complete
MSKIFSLIQVNLKGFIRDWKSIVILIVFPLILITLIFASFNPDGLQVINGGVISEVTNFNLAELTDYISPVMHITGFNSVDECLEDLKKYNQYLCIQITGDTSYVLNVYFDNTREPVIWEILQKLKATVDILQKEKTRGVATDFISDFKETMDKLDRFKNDLKNTNSEVDNYVSSSEEFIERLETAKTELTIALNSMDQDIDTLKFVKTQLESERSELSSLMNTVRIDPNLKFQINSLNSEFSKHLSEIDNKINSYKTTSSDGRIYVNEIDTAINKARTTKQDLINYRARISAAEDEIIVIQNRFAAIETLNPETLVNPVVIQNVPVYIPEIEGIAIEKKDDIKDLIRGFNLISLQTIFPIILFLIIIFLSLLVASFISLNNINSPANDRVNLIVKISFSEIMATYASSFFIVSVPVLAILFLGHFLFKISVFSNLAPTMLLLFLVMSIFIFFGIGLSYLIKKESITLLVSTFVLIAAMFFSGFILPIERMSPLLGNLAVLLPGTLSLQAFKQVVFYDISFNNVFNYVIALIVYYFVMLGIVLGIKKVRK